MKILYFIYGLNIGGAETYIYNTISRLNNSKYHIDFVLQNKKNDNHNLINLCKKTTLNCIMSVLSQNGFFLNYFN